MDKMKLYKINLYKSSERSETPTQYSYCTTQVINPYLIQKFYIHEKLTLFYKGITGNLHLAVDIWYDNNHYVITKDDFEDMFEIVDLSEKE